MKMTNNITKNSALNSVLETSLRVLLLLSEANVWPLSKLTIAEIDFMATFGKEFGLSSNNLHGDNEYKFSQLPARKKLIDASLKKLVSFGLVSVDLEKGYRYMITDRGTETIIGLDDDYSRDYRKVVNKIFLTYNLNQPSSLEEEFKRHSTKEK